jgi:hypothetical protein
MSRPALIVFVTILSAASQAGRAAIVVSDATLTTNAEYQRGGVPPLSLEDPRNGVSPDTISSRVETFDGGASVQPPPPEPFVLAFGSATNAAGDMAVNVDGILVNGTRPRSILRAEATTTTSVTNNGSLPVDDLTYKFFISAPQLNVFDFARPSLEDELPRASYEVEISVDGDELWRSAATLIAGGNFIPRLEEEGVDLGGVITPDLPTSNRYTAQFDDFDMTSTGLLLPALAPGESFDVQSRITVEISTFPFELGGLAFIGDPGDIGNAQGFSGVISSGTPPDSVIPEPTSALIWSCLGFVVLAANAWRRRDHQTTI